MQTVYIVSAVFTVFLLILNIIHAIAVKKGVDIFKDGGKNKILTLIVMLIVVILFIAHCVTGCKSGMNTALIASGVVAVIAGLVAASAVMLPDKFGDKRMKAYFGALVLMWIIIIAHVALKFL